MRRLVLRIGYSPDEYETVRREWQKYGIELDFADDLRQVILFNTIKNCLCAKAKTVVYFFFSCAALRTKSINVTLTVNSAQAPSRHPEASA